MVDLNIRLGFAVLIADLRQILEEVLIDRDAVAIVPKHLPCSSQKKIVLHDGL